MRLGRPDHQRQEDYHAYEVDGVMVWMDRHIQPAEAERPLELDLRRFLWIKRLVLKGAKALIRSKMLP